MLPTLDTFVPAHVEPLRTFRTVVTLNISYLCLGCIAFNLKVLPVCCEHLPYYRRASSKTLPEEKINKLKVLIGTSKSIDCVRERYEVQSRYEVSIIKGAVFKDVRTVQYTNCPWERTVPTPCHMLKR